MQNWQRKRRVKVRAVLKIVYQQRKCRRKSVKCELPNSTYKTAMHKSTLSVHVLELKGDAEWKIIKNNRKTGVLSLIVCLTNLFELCSV